MPSFVEWITCRWHIGNTITMYTTVIDNWYLNILKQLHDNSNIKIYVT